ncbi:MAG: type II restriction endonuclease, partial [Calditrichaeota bacterium]
EGRRLKEYHFEVVNDELIVTDEDGELFEYIPTNKESQRIQETLFHEKQTIIENCLFGVDLNPKSVKICRLRLWIELLKNAYYKNETELETLPNIDINIKCGNSLISRFALDADLKQALKKSASKWTIDSYRLAVDTYRNAQSKEQKREMERLINEIKTNFRSEISQNDPKVKRLRELNGELFSMTKQGQLFELSKKEKDKWNAKVAKLTADSQKLEAEIEEIKSNKIYENAFEWRFEFPEVLDDNGDFVGFDVVIGNPPYIPLEAFEVSERKFFNNKYTQLERKYETSVPFILEGLSILNNKGLLAYIAPLTWQTGENYSKFRYYFFENFGLEKLINLPFNIFEDAYVDTALYFVSKETKSEYSIFAFDKKAKVETLENLEYNKFNVSDIKSPDFKVIIDKTAHQFSRFDSENFVQFGSITKSTQGLSGSNFPETNKVESEFIFPFLATGNVYNYCLLKDSVYNTDLVDKKNLIQFYQAEPKILIRRIINRQDRLSVTYCNERLVFKKDINPFIPIDEKFDCFFLTGIIASKLISFIYLNSSSIATKDDFRQTTLTELRKLPIPNINSEMQKTISEIVKDILKLKSENSDADTSNLENEIDQLVYQLYGLT